jgi:D-alanyl-lipoteichoic acid acyltransferase DltB (MBOAT superfamily)
MSLSFWVRDYLYEPIAMNKRSWGKWGIAYALVITFVLLGLWHGGSWNFIIYGAIQGLVISYEMLTQKQRSLVLDKLPQALSNTYGVIRTFAIFSISLLFFKIESLGDVTYVINHFFDGINLSYKALQLGLRDHDLITCMISVVLVFLYEFSESKWNLEQKFKNQPIVIRWAFYYLMLILVFCNGAIGNTDFIYLQF